VSGLRRAPCCFGPLYKPRPRDACWNCPNLTEERAAAPDTRARAHVSRSEVWLLLFWFLALIGLGFMAGITFAPWLMQVLMA
jgi:hypothetical protein